MCDRVKRDETDECVEYPLSQKQQKTRIGNKKRPLPPQGKVDRERTNSKESQVKSNSSSSSSSSSKPTTLCLFLPWPFICFVLARAPHVLNVEMVLSLHPNACGDS